MSRIVFHIGAHKTGTTYLQNLFHDNAAPLWEHGVVYPDIWKNHAHHVLMSPWMPRIEQNFQVTPDDARTLISDLADEHANSDRSVLLSAENFSRIGDGACDYAQLATLFERFGSFEIVYVIRGQAAMAQSVYAQVCKDAKRTPRLDSFKTRMFDDHMAGGGVPLDHADVVKRLGAAIGNEHVHVSDYDTLCQSPGGLVSAFLAPLGWSDVPDWLNQPQTRQNVSEDALALGLARLITNQPRVDRPTVTRVRNALDAKFGTDRKRSIFTRDEADRLPRDFDKSNTTLFKKCKGRAPFLAVPDAGVSPDAVTLDLIDSEFWTFLALRLNVAVSRLSAKPDRPDGAAKTPKESA